MKGVLIGAGLWILCLTTCAEDADTWLRLCTMTAGAFFVVVGVEVKGGAE